jgi:hypothetical protein
MNNETTPTNNSPEYVSPLTETEFYAQLENFDAISDLPTWKGLETLNHLPAAALPTIEAFGPAHREELHARAAEINPYDRDASMAQAISEKLNREAINLRVKSTSDDASHYVKEHCSVEVEFKEAERESHQLLTQLNEKRMVRDPSTGKMIDSGDYVLTGERRQAAGDRINDLWNRSKGLQEREAPKRLLEAKQRDWEEYTDRTRRMWELTEINRRADKMVQEDHLNAHAAARAKNLKAGSGR